MEEPYRTIQDIGQATERLAAETESTPTEKFAESQKQLNRLAALKLNHSSIPVDWEQYIAGIEVTLYRVQTESRPHVDRHQATQITIQTQAEQSWGKVREEEDFRDRRRKHREKLKLTTITASAVMLILLLIGVIGFYQWRILSSDEGWFRDISKKRWQIVERRMRFGKSVETKDHKGMTGFLYLARTGTLDDLKKMKALGADLHARDKAGLTSLHHAAANANRDAVAWLTSEGLDVNVTDNAGTTPLHYFFIKAPGTSFGLATYRYLLDQGAKANVSNDEESLLMAAILWVRGGAFAEKPADILKELIEKGADVNHRGQHGSTALNNALIKYLPQTPKPISLIDNDPIVKLLLESGATHEDQAFSLTDELENSGEQRIEFSPSL